MDKTKGGGGGNSKLGSVGAAGRREFNGWERPSRALPMPGAGTAGTARAAMLDGSRWPAYRPASEREDCRLGGKDPANELTGFNVQSRPPGRAPEGLEGSRRGEMSIAGGRDRGRRVRETLVDL